MPSNVFRRTVPRELIERAVRALGFDDLDDIRWIDETASRPTLMEQVKGEIADYYLPCIRKRVLEKENFDYKDFLTIVRQLLKSINRKLLYKDACKTVKKRVYEYRFIYSIEPAATLEQPRVVSF